MLRASCLPALVAWGVILTAHLAAADPPPRTRIPVATQPEVVTPRVRPGQLPPEVIRPTLPPGDPAWNEPVPNDWPQVRRGSTQRYGGRQATDRSAREYAPRIRPGNQASAIWYVGINMQRAPLGLRISEVTPRSPAQQFGLEVGDYLLDVGGYVVGEYQGVYYPFASAMDFATDPSGWVELLVWNKRTQAKQTLWIRAQRRR